MTNMGFLICLLVSELLGCTQLTMSSFSLQLGEPETLSLKKKNRKASDNPPLFQDWRSCSVSHLVPFAVELILLLLYPSVVCCTSVSCMMLSDWDAVTSDFPHTAPHPLSVVPSVVEVLRR